MAYNKGWDGTIKGKLDKDKEFICRKCVTFLDTEDLVDGKCPKCDTDEHVFLNELDEE